MPLQRLAVIVAALWWGGISALSFLAVPTLFMGLGNPAVAGPVAAKLFSLQCWAGLFLGAALMLILRRQRSFLVDGSASPESLAALKSVLITLGLVLVAVLLAMVQEFGVAQKIVSARAAGGSLRLWHSLGSVMVLGQWLCTGAVLWRLAGRATGPTGA